jgi:hypothetical protein
MTSQREDNLEHETQDDPSPDRQGQDRDDTSDGQARRDRNEMEWNTSCGSLNRAMADYEGEEPKKPLTRPAMSKDQAAAAPAIPTPAIPLSN